MPERSALQYQANKTIAYRLRAGVFAYVVIFGIIAAYTPYYHEHPGFFTGVGVFLLLATVSRAACSWMFESRYRKNPRAWRRFNAVSTASLALAWGILCMMSIYFYSWNWTTMVTCLSAGAFSAGIVVALSINLRLTLTYLLLMFVPTLVMTAGLETSRSEIAALLFGTYLVFLILIARRLNKEYWLAMQNQHLIKEHTRELEMKNAELEAFAYSVSHDLRTPLRSLDGFSELLAEDAGNKLNDTERDYLRRIRNAAQQMGQLIDDILKLSRITRAEFHPGEVNLSEIVRENIELLRQDDPGKKVEVEIEPDVKTRGDESLLDIAISNLISNAWKYSPKDGDSKIRFATTRMNDQVVYYVKNNGIGFDPRYVNKLFNPFQRLHHKHEYPGSGIGLATVKRIVQRHGGRVWANGKVNKGATFYFTIEGEEREEADA